MNPNPKIKTMAAIFSRTILKSFKPAFLSSLAVLFLESANCFSPLQAQTTSYFPPAERIVADDWADIRILPANQPARDSAYAICLQLSPEKPKRNVASLTAYSSANSTLQITNLSGTLFLDTTLCRITQVETRNGSKMEGVLPYVPCLSARAEEGSTLHLRYASPNMEATAVQASTLRLDGESPMQLQYLRADGGSSVFSQNLDTTEVLRTRAYRLSIIDASQSPCRISFDTLSGQSIVKVDALESYPLVGGGSMHASSRIPESPAGTGQNPEAADYHPAGNRNPATKGYDDPSSDFAYYLEDLALHNIGMDNPFISRQRKRRARFRGQWMGLEYKAPFWGQGYGFRTSLPEPWRDMELDVSRVLGVAWNVIQVSVGFNSPHWGLVTGFGFLWENYHFSNKSTRLEVKDYRLQALTDPDPDKNYIKSKLGVSYFRIPILFEYNNARGAFRTFHVSAGVIPGVLMANWTKQVCKLSNGQREKTKQKGDFQVNPFRLDAACYVGWGPLSFYFTYSPLHFFRYGKGPDVTPFGVGILIGCH